MKNKLDDDLDALFRLPLAEFISARTTLAARLKKEGRTAEADQVKAIIKPSISVWSVNQLYWRHRDQFDKLIAAGQRFRRAHTSRTAKAFELNQALEARRDALNHLSDLAAILLSRAGHNPSLETLRRIATTLEAMSAYAALPDDQAAGRLTKDLDPPGFESLAPFIRAVPTTRQPDAAARGASSSKSVSTTKKPQPATNETRRDEDSRQARLAAAKASLQNAKKSLVDARAKAQTLTAEQKKADAAVKNLEKEKREAEQRFKAASTASTEAAVRAQNLALELARAKKGLTEAEHVVESASKELESLARQS
jgi:hypothetical protein